MERITKLDNGIGTIRVKGCTGSQVYQGSGKFENKQDLTRSLYIWSYGNSGDTLGEDVWPILSVRSGLCLNKNEAAIHFHVSLCYSRISIIAH